MEIVLHRELSERVLGIAFTVHSGLGPGLLEMLYESAYCIELARAGIPFERQKRYSVSYQGECIGEYLADVVVADTVLLEFKAVRQFSEAMEAQVINYLRISGLTVGYLLNFAGARLQWKRFVCGGCPRQ